MALDPNIALQVNNQVIPGPMDLLSKLDTLRKLKNQNMLFKLETESAAEAGKFYQQNTRPDGTLDEAGFRRAIANSPTTSWNAGKFFTESQAREGERQKLEAAEYGNMRTRLTLLADGLGSLAILGDNVTKADVYDVASRLIQSLPNDKKMYTDLLKEIKDAPDGGKALAQWVQQRQLQVAPFKERMDVVSPPSIPVQTGGTVNMVQPGRIMPSRGTGELEVTATPGERSALVPARDPASGAPIAVPRQGAAPMITGTGRVEGAAVQPTMALGPTTEQEMELTTAPKHLAERLETIRNQVSGAQTRMQELAKMRDLLERVGSGKFAGTRTEIAAAAQTLNMPEEVVRWLQGGADPRAVAAAQQYIKSAWTQAAASMKQMMPAGTQWTGQEIFTNAAANPNIDMDPQAARELFDFYTFQYEFLKEEQDFRTNWRKFNPDKSLRQMETDWTKYAESKGWVEPIKTGPGTPQDTVAARLDRDTRIPKDISLTRLGMQPRGSRREYILENGSAIWVQRGAGDKGNTYTLVPAPQGR